MLVSPKDRVKLLLKIKFMNKSSRFEMVNSNEAIKSARGDIREGRVNVDGAHGADNVFVAPKQRTFGLTYIQTAQVTRSVTGQDKVLALRSKDIEGRSNIDIN